MLRIEIACVSGETSGSVLLASQGLRVPLPPISLVIVFDRLGRRTRVKHMDANRIRQTFSTWAIENRLRKLKGQSLLGHSPSTMVRR